MVNKEVGWTKVVILYSELEAEFKSEYEYEFKGEEELELFIVRNDYLKYMQISKRSICCPDKNCPF